MRILDHTRLFQFRGCARSKPQFLTAVQSLKLFRWTQAYVWMDYQLVKFGNVCWKHSPVSQPRGNLECHTREGVIPSHSHSDNCVFFGVN